MSSFTPTLVGGICKFCHVGELHQYVEDAIGKHRCGRCGEFEAEGTMLSPDESTNPDKHPDATEDTPYPEGTVIQVPAAKRTTTRKKTV